MKSRVSAREGRDRKGSNDSETAERADLVRIRRRRQTWYEYREGRPGTSTERAGLVYDRLDSGTDHQQVSSACKDSSPLL